jgi:aminopeptidase N
VDDASVYVAADAGAALGKTKAPGAYEALIEGLKRESHRDQIRHRIMDGLKDLGDPRGAPVAMGYVDYSWGKGIQHQLRHAAFDAMVALAPDAPETKAWVAKLVKDPYFRMKQWAAEACVKLKLAEALPALDDVAKNGIGPGVRDAAKSAAEKLRAAPKPAADDDE